MSGSVKQRYQQANYLNTAAPDGASETWSLMGAGFTDLNESPSAQTSSKRYVNDKSTTKRITGYDWTTAFNTDMVLDEAAVKFICDIGELQKAGADAETDYVIVDLDQAAEGSANTFHARKLHVAVEVASFENNDGEMSASGNLLQIGDLEEGWFNTTTKTYTTEKPTV